MGGLLFVCTAGKFQLVISVVLWDVCTTSICYVNFRVFWCRWAIAAFVHWASRIPSMESIGCCHQCEWKSGQGYLLPTTPFSLGWNAAATQAISITVKLLEASVIARDLGWPDYNNCHLLARFPIPIDLVTSPCGLWLAPPTMKIHLFLYLGWQLDRSPGQCSLCVSLIFFHFLTHNQAIKIIKGNKGES